MSKCRSFMKRIKCAADGAFSPIPGTTLIEITGNNRVLIENHKGVIQYTGELICVKSKQGSISITGTMMNLGYMSKERLVITGKISALEL